MHTTLVTGANRGLGLELSRLHLEDGWRVIAASRTPASPALEELAARHRERLLRPRLDVTEERGIAALAEDLDGQPVDRLILNAGIYGPTATPFGETPVQEWLEVLRVNTIAPLKLAEAFSRQVARSERRQIALITSLMGSIADNSSGGHYPYRSSKAALNMVAKSLAVDLAPLEITVVALHPGWVRTDMGGADATLSIEQSCAGMKRVLDGLRPADSGRFFGWDGTAHPW